MNLKMKSVDKRDACPCEVKSSEIDSLNNSIIQYSLSVGFQCL